MSCLELGKKVEQKNFKRDQRWRFWLQREVDSCTCTIFNGKMVKDIIISVVKNF